MSATDPVELLLEKVIGCCKQCPFCKSPCCLTKKDHAGDHRALQHYPVGVGGIRDDDDNKLQIYNCQSAIDSTELFNYDEDKPDRFEPYKVYRKYYPDWEIKPDRSMEASLYWKWFMNKFHDELTVNYQAEHADIPIQWKSITWEEAEQSLKDIV
jgi:hypothetical protein